MLQGASIKTLAFRILEEMLARNTSGTVCPIPPVQVGQDAGEDTDTLHLQRDEVGSCGSPHCAGCYDVGDGRKIHPPKCGEEYKKWLKRWQPRGKLQ